MFETTGVPAAAPASLVRDDGFVHSAVYTDQRIFELEMERIFHRSWLYIGHDSEIPKAGDFRRRTMGRFPVVLVRGKDGEPRVLINRCRHRGAMVCEVDQGSTQVFRCPYHGWSYDTAGHLVGLHGRKGYDDALDPELTSLTPVPRVASYRGLLFASLSATGMPLEQHLGRAASRIDIALNASPLGTVTLSHGVQKTRYRGNWKLVGMDGYHPTILHASMFSMGGKAPQPISNDPWAEGSASVARHLDNGHVMLDLTPSVVLSIEEHCRKLQKVPGGAEYIRDLRAAHGVEKADEVISLSGDPHMGLFPNLQLVGTHIRVIEPLAADLTEVHMYPMRLDGVSPEINQLRLRQHEFSHGPASFVGPDDTEIFERTQVGMTADAVPWLNLTRGLRRERLDHDGTTIGGITDEVPQRFQLHAWRELMAREAA